MDWNPVDLASTAARLAGHAWDDIEGFFADHNEAAKDAGATDTDTSNIWGVQPADQLQQSLNTDAGIKAAADPDVTKPIATAEIPPVTPLEGLSAARIAGHATVPVPTPQVPEADADTTTSPLDFNEPSARSAYADAMQSGAVKSPQDFAERYAGAYLGSAYSNGVPPPDSAYAAATRGAATLAAALPNARDLTDTAIAVARVTNQDATTDSVGTVKTNMLDEWANNGTPLMEMYRRTQTDPAFADRMTKPPEPPPPPWYEQFGAGVGDMFSGATQLIEHAVPGALHGPGAAMSEYGGIDAMQSLTQPELPSDFFSNQAKQRLLDLKAEGYPDDSIARMGGQIAATIPLATTFGLSGAWGWLAAGASGGAAIGAFTPSTAENYWTDKAEEVAASGVGGAVGGVALGGAFKLFGKLISKMLPDAADHLAYIINKSVEPEVPVSDPSLPPGTPPKMVKASEAFAPVEPAKTVPVVEPEAGAPAAEAAPPKIDLEATPAAKIERTFPEPFELMQRGELTADRAEQLSEQTAGHAKQTEDEVFGEDADRWRSLQRRSNSAWNRADDAKAKEYDAQIGEIENKIAPEQLDRVQGINEQGLVDPQEWKDISRDLRDVEASKEDAVETISKYLRHLPAEGQEPTMGERTAIAVIGRAMQAETERGGDPIELLRSAFQMRGARYGGGADAEELVKDQMRRLKALMENPVARPAETQTALPIPQRLLPAPPAGLDPEATPAAKIERIAQDAGENPKPSPTFFEDKLAEYGETDPKTVALAQSHDASAGYLNYLKNTFSDLMTDESGRLRLFAEKEPKAPSEERRAVIAMKNAADGLIRQQANGMMTQNVDHVAQQWEPLRKVFAPHMPEWEAALDKVYAATGYAEKYAAVESAKQTEIGRYLMAVEGQGTLDPSSPLAPALKMRGAIRGFTDNKLLQAIGDKELNPVAFREFYFPHLYERGQGVTLAAKRGGSVGFTKQRTYDTVFDAMMENHRLRYPHPIDTDIAGDTAKLKALSTLRIQAVAKDNNWMRYHMSADDAEPGWRPVVGLMSKKPFGYVDSTTGEARSAEQQLYAPPGFARLYNNFIGYQDYTTASTSFKNFEDGLMRAKNLSTHLKLLLPLYHTVAEYKEGIAAAFGNATLEALHGVRHGDFGEVLRGLRDYATAFAKPIYYVGKAGVVWRPMYRAAEQDPNLATLNPQLKALQAFVAGGGSIARRAPEYQESTAPTLWRSYARGELGQDIMRDFHNVGSVAQGVALPFKELSRVTTSLSAPIWDHYIPLLKAGAAMERIQTYLRQNPLADEAAVNAFSRQVVTQMEDRFGEYNMNNLFWKPALRRVTNQAMLSTSWTYGTIHSLLTGLGWNPGRGLEWNPAATADLIGHLSTIAFTNAAWSYAIDGKAPDNYLDYLAPFANARGLARVLLPGQEKEFYDWLGIIKKSVSMGIDQGPAAGFRTATGLVGAYAFGKLAPIYQAAAGWLEGQDGVGHWLDFEPSTAYNILGHKVKLAGPIDYLAKIFLPIFVQNWDDNAAKGLTPVQQLFGLRPAAQWMTNWDIWRMGQQKYHALMTRLALSRAGKEAIAKGEPLPEGYSPPQQKAPAQLNRRQRAEQAAAGILTARQAAAGQSAYAVRAEGEQYLQQTAGERLQQFHDATAQTLNRSRALTTRSRPAYSNAEAYTRASRRVQVDPETGETILRGQGANARQDVAQRYLHQLVRADQARRQRTDFRRRARLVYGRYTTGNESAINPAGIYQGV